MELSLKVKESFTCFTWMPQLPVCWSSNPLLFLQNRPTLGLTLREHSNYSLMPHHSHFLFDDI